VSNDDVARALREMACFLEMDGVPFKPRAYEKAAYAVAALDRPIADAYREGGVAALDAVPGIGKGIAERIGGMLSSGSLAELERLRRKTPIDILDLTAIEGVGPKRAHALYDGLGVRTLRDLEQAATEGRVRTLPHFGERSEQRILQAITFHREAAGRRPLSEALVLARRIEAALEAVPGVVQATAAGSIRRHRDTIGDLDLLVASERPSDVSAAFERLPLVRAVLAHGPTKTLVRLSNGMDADLRVLAPESFGAALLYFTGSKAHNIALRKLALKRGLELNEYGLFRAGRSIAGRTEQEVYEALGLAWIPPELREDAGEVELAARGELPTLVAAPDIRGDLQMHTTWSDGSASIEAMARAARALGREYLAITDHTHELAMTHGLDAQRLREQIAEVRRVERELGGIRLLAGAEVNIRPDGSLDLDDGVLGELDLVGAAIHSHFEQPREQLTARILRAVEHPLVHILFHPQCRAIGRRRALDFDLDAVLAACQRTGTVLEIDSQPERLDLPDTVARSAVRAGVRLAIDSDAHAPGELRYIEDFGIGVARRGWAEPRHILNALPIDELSRELARPAEDRR
jgi:DNA polymerase (family 10)